MRAALMVLGPLLVLAGLEGGLRLADYGIETAFLVPVGEGEAYTTNERFGWRFFPPEQSRPTAPCLLSADKPHDAYRIFVLGGSAAFGTPRYSLAFCRILEAMLREQFPQVRFEVVNAATVAINSHVALTIAQDCARHEPDLFIVYAGNNEVVGPYGPGTVFRSFTPQRWLLRSGIALRGTRTGQLLSNTLRRLAPARQSPREFEGMEMFVDNLVPRDDPRLQTAYAQFRANLQDLCDLAADRNARVLLCTVATNLKDCPPFASVHRQGLSDTDRQRWDTAFAAGEAARRNADLDTAAQHYAAALALDDQYADLHYRIAQLHLQRNDPDSARRHFTLARDLDALRFRCDSTLNDILRQLPDQAGEHVQLVDVARALAAASPQGIAGEEVLHEHVHLTFAGNYLAARELFPHVAAALPERLRGQGLPPSPPSFADASRLLALSSTEVGAMARMMLNMISRPPFTRQLDHEAHVLRQQQRVEETAGGVTPDALQRERDALAAAVQRWPDDLNLRERLGWLENARGSFAEARGQFENLTRRLPGRCSMYHYQLSQSLLGQRRLDLAAAELRRVLALNPWDVNSLYDLGMVLLRNQPPDPAGSEPLFLRALELRPRFVQAHIHLGWARILQNRPDDALPAFRAAVASDPNDPEARATLAEVLGRHGKTDEALALYESSADRLTDPHVHFDFARLLLDRARYAPAASRLRRTLELRPDWVEPAALLALLLAGADDDSVRDGPEALRLAHEWDRRTNGKDPRVQDALAAALAETGRFDLAAATAAKGARLAEALQRPDLARLLTARRALYETGKPLRLGQEIPSR